MTASALPATGGGGRLARLSDLLVRRPALLTALLLGPPLVWLGVVYLGSLAALLVQSAFSVDEFTGMIDRTPTLKTYGELLRLSNLDIILRTVLMAAAVTVAAAVIAFPIALYAAFHARGRLKAAFYFLVMMPLWSAYLVKVYAWKLLLAKEGVVGWVFERLGLGAVLDAILALPVVGGPSLSTSYLGTFLVFTYIWLPYMILPVQAALERVPASLLEAAGDLGATPRQSFRTVVLPLALPGVAAGSIFTFSLTLGDFIIPQIVGGPSLYIGQAVLIHQGTAGNIPLAAAFATVPIAVMGLYLWGAKRMGAFDAL